MPPPSKKRSHDIRSNRRRSKKTQVIRVRKRPAPAPDRPLSPPPAAEKQIAGPNRQRWLNAVKAEEWDRITLRTKDGEEIGLSDSQKKELDKWIDEEQDDQVLEVDGLVGTPDIFGNYETDAVPIAFFTDHGILMLELDSKPKPPSTTPLSKRSPDGRTRSEKPKRPQSAYLVFCQEKGPALRAKYPSLKFGDISKKLGALWQDLDKEDKDPYERKAFKNRLSRSASKNKEYWDALLKKKR